METNAASVSPGELDAPGAVLAFARNRRVAADRAEADLLQAAVVWADQHPAESLEAAEVFRAPGFWGGFGDTAVPIAGPGAPLVAEFSVAEFAAAVGLSTEAGKRYVGHAVDLWSSPHRYQYLRDHTGTLDVTHERRSPAAPPDE